MTAGILTSAWFRIQYGYYFWPNSSDPAILNWEQGEGWESALGQRRTEEIPLQSRRLCSPAVATQAKELGTLSTHFLRLAQG